MIITVKFMNGIYEWMSMIFISYIKYKHQSVKHLYYICIFKILVCITIFMSKQTNLVDFMALCLPSITLPDKRINNRRFT